MHPHRVPASPQSSINMVWHKQYPHLKIGTVWWQCSYQFPLHNQCQPNRSAGQWKNNSRNNTQIGVEPIKALYTYHIWTSLTWGITEADFFIFCIWQTYLHQSYSPSSTQKFQMRQHKQTCLYVYSSLWCRSVYISSKRTYSDLIVGISVVQVKWLWYPLREKMLGWYLSSM